MLILAAFFLRLCSIAGFFQDAFLNVSLCDRCHCCSATTAASIVVQRVPLYTHKAKKKIMISKESVFRPCHTCSEQEIGVAFVFEEKSTLLGVTDPRLGLCSFQKKVVFRFHFFPS